MYAFVMSSEVRFARKFFATSDAHNCLCVAYFLNSVTIDINRPLQSNSPPRQLRPFGALISNFHRVVIHPFVTWWAVVAGISFGVEG